MEECLSFVERLRKYENKSIAIDTQDEAQSFTLRVIGNVALGGETTESAYFYDIQFARDIQYTFAFAIKYFIFPFPRFIWNMSSERRQIEEDAKAAAKRMRTNGGKVIKQRKEYLNEQASSTGKLLLRSDVPDVCMIDALIRRNHITSSSTSIKTSSELHQEEPPITDDELLDNVVQVYAAGSETTSVGICWTLFYLAQNKQICAQIRKEVGK